jgi:hypothetical protein
LATLIGWQGTGEGLGELGDRGVALLWIFGQSLKDHGFDTLRKARQLVRERRRGCQDVLATDFGERAREGGMTTEPFVHHNGQGILIGGRDRFPHELFRGHIGDGASNFLRALVARTVCDNGDAKVAEQNVLVGRNEHIFGLNITMDNFVVMGILKCRSNLFDVITTFLKCHLAPFGMSLAECAMRCIVHDEKGDLILHPEIMDLNNMGMFQGGDGLCFAEKMLHFVLFHLCLQYFYC